MKQLIPFLTIVLFLLTNCGNLNDKLIDVSARNSPYSPYIAREYLDKGADVNVKNEDGITPLMAASSAGNSETVNVLFSNGAEVNAQNVEGLTALYLAAHKGYFAIVHNLLVYGADPNIESASGYSPLLAAIIGKHLSTANRLISAGAEVNATTQFGYTPLHSASKNGYSNLVKRLIKSGANNNVVEDQNRDTPLIYAAYWGHKEIVDHLIESGANIHHRNQQGCTAVMIAYYWGNENIAEVLKKAGAKVEQKSECIPNDSLDDHLIEFYSKDIKSRPHYAPAYVMRGHKYYDIGKYNLAIADHTKAIELDPEYVEAYINRGYTHYSLHEYDLAVNDYNKAIQLEPSFAMAYNNLAWLYITAKDEHYLDPKKALPLALKATKLSVDDPAIFDTLAAVYAELGRYAEAIKTETQVIEILKQQGVNYSAEEQQLDSYKQKNQKQPDVVTSNSEEMGPQVGTKRQNRFIAHNNGTVTDTKTDLMWASSDSGNGLSQKMAQNYCDLYEIAGYSDWRMPTVKELDGLYNAGIRTSDQEGNHIIKIYWKIHNSSLEFGPYDFDIGFITWDYRKGMDDKHARALPVRQN